MGYVVFVNYLYFAKVLPALKTAPSALPSGQLQHVQTYLNLLNGKGETPLFLFYIKNIKTITLVILFLMVPSFLHVFGVI